MTPRQLARFVASLQFIETDTDLGECWIWTGCMVRGGYGVRGGRLAHRMSYEHFVAPIPSGLEIDHLCRNRGCMNPRHLEPVTHQENIRRGALCSDSPYYMRELMETQMRVMRALVTPEGRARGAAIISAKSKGRPHAPEHTAKIAAANRGKIRSEEVRAKLLGNTNNLGHRPSLETRAKLAESIRASWTPARRAEQGEWSRVFWANQTPEFRDRMRAVRVGKVMSEQARAKMRQAWVRRKAKAA